MDKRMVRSMMSGEVEPWMYSLATRAASFLVYEPADENTVKHLGQLLKDIEKEYELPVGFLRPMGSTFSEDGHLIVALNNEQLIEVTQYGLSFWATAAFTQPLLETQLKITSCGYGN